MRVRSVEWCRKKRLSVITSPTMSAFARCDLSACSTARPQLWLWSAGLSGRWYKLSSFIVRLTIMSTMHFYCEQLKEGKQVTACFMCSIKCRVKTERMCSIRYTKNYCKKKYSKMKILIFIMLKIKYVYKVATHQSHGSFDIFGCGTCWNGSDRHKTEKCQTLPNGICITHTCLVWISPLLTQTVVGRLVSRHTQEPRDLLAHI